MENVFFFFLRQGREDYLKAYEKTLQLWDVAYTEKYTSTSFGESHSIFCGDEKNPPLVLLHAASCGSTIWYPNVKALSQNYAVHAIDLITEASKSALLKPIKGQAQCAKWLDETLNGLDIKEAYLCGLSIGGWSAANYSSLYPQRVKKLVLLSPIQTFTKMYASFFIKIMKMGLKPTRKSVEEYLGWGGGKEPPLPESVINQFTISALNINPNIVYPKVLKKEMLKNIKIPVLVLFGENEFAFNAAKAVRVAQSTVEDLKIETVENASHLISVSSPDYTNERILRFLYSRT
jgi:pimeloyl-ACP methyl ester carboxylesterase